MIYNKVTAVLRGFIELPELKLGKYRYLVSLEFFQPQVYITEALYNLLTVKDLITGECELELTPLTSTGFMYEATSITLIFREGGAGSGSTSIQNLQWDNATQILQLVTDPTTFTADLSQSFTLSKNGAIQETIDYTKTNAYVRKPEAGDKLKQNDVILYQGNLYSLKTDFTWLTSTNPVTDTIHFQSLKAEGATYKGDFADDNAVITALRDETLKLGDTYQASSVSFGITSPVLFIVINPTSTVFQEQVLPYINNISSYLNGDNLPPSSDKFLSSQKTYEELLKKQDKLLHTFFFASFEPVTGAGILPDTYTLKQDTTLTKGVFSKNLTTTDDNFIINFRSNPSNLADTIPSGQIISLVIPANLTNTTSSINFNIESTLKLINGTARNVAVNVTNITLNTATQQKLIDLVVTTDVSVNIGDVLELSLKFVLDSAESCTINLEIGEISNPMYVDFVTTASKLDPSIIVEDTNLGEIRAMHRSSPPNDTWLLCDGSTYQKVDYPDLYKILKTNIPSLIIDDDNFNVPDLREGYLRSADNNSNLGENLAPAIPNIKGTFRISDTKNLLGSGSGALVPISGYGGYDVSSTSSLGRYCGVDLNANAYSKIYQDGINEVRPKSTITNYFIKAKANIQNFSSVIAKPIVGQIYPKDSLIIWEGVIYRTTQDTTYSSLTPNWVPYSNQASVFEMNSVPLGTQLQFISNPDPENWKICNGQELTPEEKIKYADYVTAYGNFYPKNPKLLVDSGGDPVNGMWEKYSDGTMVQRLFRPDGTPFSWTYPVPFSNNPNYTTGEDVILIYTSSQGNNGTFYCSPDLTSTATQSGRITNNTGSSYVIEAYGRWTDTLPASNTYVKVTKPIKGTVLDIVSYPMIGQEYPRGSAIWFDGQIYQALNTNTWNGLINADWGIYTPSNIVPLNNLLGKGKLTKTGSTISTTIPISQRSQNDVITVEGAFSGLGSILIINGFKLRIVLNLSNGVTITPSIISRLESDLTQQKYDNSGPWFDYYPESNNIDYIGELVTFSMTFSNMIPTMNSIVKGECCFVSDNYMYKYSLVFGTDSSKQLDATKIESITVMLNNDVDLPLLSDIYVYLDNRNILQSSGSGNSSISSLSFDDVTRVLTLSSSDGDFTANFNSAFDTNQITAVNEAITFTKDNLYVRKPNIDDQLAAKEIILHDGILYRTKNQVIWSNTTNPTTDSTNFELVVTTDTGGITDLTITDNPGGSKELNLVTTGQTFSVELPSGADPAMIMSLLQMFYQQGQLVGELLNILSMFSLSSLALPANFFLTYNGNIYKTKQAVTFTSSSTPNSDTTNYELINKNTYNWIEDSNPSVSIARVVTTVVIKTSNNFSMPKDPYCAVWIATIQDETGNIVSYVDNSSSSEIVLEFNVSSQVKIKIEQYCSR